MNNTEISDGKSGLTIHSAKEEHIPFMVEAIIAAEMGDSDKLSYANIFGIQRAEVVNMLGMALRSGVEDSEFSLSAYCIASINDIPVGTMAMWQEEKSGIPSSTIKAHVLSRLLPDNVFFESGKNMDIVSQVRIERSPKELQIEAVYIDSRYRGMGIFRAMLHWQVQKNTRESSDFRKIQIILDKTNTSAVKAYTNAGFVTALEKHSNDPAVLNLVPSDTMLLMEAELDSLIYDKTRHTTSH